jgi:uncharacterized protein YneF (UPF0154 family)
MEWNRLKVIAIAGIIVGLIIGFYLAIKILSWILVN